MAKHGKGPKPDPDAVAADLELFASFVRSEERKEREAKAAARAERREADEHARLVKAKDDAAAEVKRLRASERATAEQKAAADDAYKAALAALVAAETGEAPAWAPAQDEPAVEQRAEDEAPADAEDTEGDEVAEAGGDATTEGDGQ